MATTQNKKYFHGLTKNEFMNFVFVFANVSLLQLFSAEELQQKVLEEKINQTFCCNQFKSRMKSWLHWLWHNGRAHAS